MKNRIPALICLAALLLVPGCGQPNPSSVGDPTGLIAASADATTAAGTARMSMQMTMTTPQGDVSVDAEGAYDFANRLGEMSMEMNLPEAAGEMGGPQKIEMVFEGLVIYMRYPLMSQLAPDAKPWIRMDLQKIGEEAGMDLGSMMQTGSSDPSQMLEWLRGVSGDVEVVGEEEVRGAAATHYRGTIDLNKVADQAPEELRRHLKASMSAMVEAIGSSSIPFDVWIDAQGRAVRMKQSFDFQGGAAEGASMSMTVDIFDFGAEVHIDIPPASETSDFEELMSSMSGGMTSSGSSTTSP